MLWLRRPRTLCQALRLSPISWLPCQGESPLMILFTGLTLTSAVVMGRI